MPRKANTKPKPLVVIGMLGTKLDFSPRQRGPRWDKWRPTVSLCQHESLLVSRLELLHPASHTALARAVAEDIACVSPETTVTMHRHDTRNPWDPESEDYLVHITTGTHVAQICLFLLTESRHMPARLIQTSPLRDGDRTAPGSYDIIDLDLSKYDRLATRFAQEVENDVSFLKSGIETRNASFNAIIERIERVASNSAEPILLHGPTGAGKSQLGRRIYELKRNRRLLSGEFVEVNCATLRGDQAMAALFGHAKGAFTGASAAREGLLRAADGGMLFLDEIGELGLDEQAMLLRAVEDKRFLPLGSDQETSSDFHLIAGTNRDLVSAVRAGRFREDLLARINLWTFRLPGLAERTEDIAPNLDYELDRVSRRLGRRITINREARESFLAFASAPSSAWTANFRDLGAAVSRMGTLADAGRIDSAVVREEITRLGDQWRAATGPEDVSGCSEETLLELLGQTAYGQLDHFDAIQLAGVVRVCGQSANLSEAGRKLFSKSRERRKSANDADRLRKYLVKFGLTWEVVRG